MCASEDAEPTEGGLWSDTVDQRLYGRLVNASLECFKNANRLLADAEVLAKSGSYSSAVALAIHAEEELGKAMLLGIAANNRRWDKPLLDAVTKHNEKQGLAAGLKRIAQGIESHANLASGLLPLPPLDMNGLVQEGLAQFQKTRRGKTEKLKQNRLYVGISRDGTLTSLPAKHSSQAEAENAISGARQSQRAMAHIGNHLGLDMSAYLS